MEKRKEVPRDHRSWEEQIYWSHFQTLHFSQFLRAGFDRQLAIPETFATNLKSKLPGTVTLKGPSGIEWEVGLTSKDNTVFFDHGWGQFVKDQCLKENDILVFKYDGVSRFDVLPFNGQTMCEKVGSYFVRKCCCKGPETPCHCKRSSCGSSAEAVSSPPRKDVGGAKRKKLMQKNVEKKVPRVIELDEPINTIPCTTNQEIPACFDEFETKPDIANTGMDGKSEADQEKQRMLDLAQAIVSPEGFLIVMKPTHVTKKFNLSLPQAWVCKHFTFEKNHFVILRVNEKTWKARLFCIRKPRERGVLGGRWKEFALDNNLREFDVCVFEPRGELNNTMVLDVYICHVG